MMKIYLKQDLVEPIIVTLDDGTNITRDIMVNAVEIKAKCGDLVKAILTVYPSEVIYEGVDGDLKFKKHPSYDELENRKK